MGEHDAASIVGQLAGLSTAGAKVEKVTPEQLIRRFCPDGATETDGVTTARGRPTVIYLARFRLARTRRTPAALSKCGGGRAGARTLGVEVQQSGVGLNHSSSR